MVLDIDEESLFRFYYQRLFPFKEMYSWLSYGNVEKDYFLKREFSFTLKINEEEAYVRFRSFPDAESFSKEIKKVNPRKIDIGAVYTVSPRDKASFEKAFFPVEKELVFDLDLTDYDVIRTCCEKANICNKCWEFMTIGIKIIDLVLREDFGFENLLWVYSGRRGVHCWVSDQDARKLSSDARGAIVHYLSVITGGENKQRKVELSSPLHPTFQKIYDTILLKHFEDHILVEQGLLDTEESQQKILAMVPFENVRQAVAQHWATDDQDLPPITKWKDLMATVAKQIEITEKGKDSRSKVKTFDPIKEIVFNFTYPRLDVNVSLGLNHLLKSPFCVHPSTGRVCVPIDPTKCEEFDPLKVPQVKDLIEEIEAYDAKHPVTEGQKSIRDMKKTQLKPFIDFFKSAFLEPLHQIAREQKRLAAADAMEF